MMLKTTINILKILFLVGFISSGLLIITLPQKQLLWFITIYFLYFFISSVMFSHAFENKINRREILKGIIKILLGAFIVYLVYYNVFKLISLFYIMDQKYGFNASVNATSMFYSLIELRKKSEIKS